MSRFMRRQALWIILQNSKNGFSKLIKTPLTGCEPVRGRKSDYRFISSSKIAKNNKK